MTITLRVLDPFVVGLQLGRIQSPAALAIVERRPGASEKDAVVHDLRHLRRWPVGTAYPAIIHDVAKLLNRPLPAGYVNRDALGQVSRTTIARQATALAVNATGVGRAAVALFADEGLDLRIAPTWVTTGDQALEDADGWRVPQRDLVATVQVLRQQDRLLFAKTLREGPELDAQMDAFHVVPGAGGRDRYEPSEGEDLVLALALACWWGEFVSPAQVEVVPGDFSAFSQEALEYERRKRRIKSRPSRPTGPMADGIG